MKIWSGIITLLLGTLFIVPALGQVPFQFPNINNSSNSFFGDDCSASGCGLADSFDCWKVTNVSGTMSGLSPKLPIFECIFKGNENNTRPSIIRTGSYLPFYRNYIVKQGSDFKQISTEKEFVSLFAPVETPDEAIAFAIALTRSFPLYDTRPPDGYYPVSSSLQQTHAEEIDGMFKVHLFDQERCGCGSQPYYAVDYLVTRDGKVTELSRKKVYDRLWSVCVLCWYISSL